MVVSPLSGLGSPGPTRRQIAPASGIPRQFAAAKYIDLTLDDIDQRRHRRLGDAEAGHQAAAGAAMRGRDHVAGQAVVPALHARLDHLVALAVRRHEMILVVLAL